MEAFWLAATQMFWWVMFAFCAIGFVAMSLVLVCLALRMRDADRLAEETKEAR